MMDKPKELTKEEKDVMMFLNMTFEFEYYDKYRNIRDGFETVFERLREKDLIGDPEKYKGYFSKRVIQAKEQLQAEYKNFKSFDKDERIRIAKVLEEVKGNISPKIQIRAKQIIVGEYFQKLLDNERTIEDVLEENWNYKRSSLA